jgi:hypothetical protein
VQIDAGEKNRRTGLAPPDRAGIGRNPMSTLENLTVFAQPDTLTISGRDDVLSIPDESSPDMGLATIAFSMMLSALSGVQGLYSRDATDNSGAGNHLSIFTRNDMLIARVVHEGQETLLVHRGIAANEDTHVALNFDGSMVALYVDGEKVDETASGYTPGRHAPLHPVRRALRRAGGIRA